METLPIVDQAAVLLILIAIIAATAWLFRRFPIQSWFKRRLPWLSYEDTARNWEAIACTRPFNYLSMMVLIMLGIFVVLEDLGLTPLAPILRYGTAILLAAVVLYAARRSAAQRAA